MGREQRRKREYILLETLKKPDWDRLILHADECNVKRIIDDDLKTQQIRKDSNERIRERKKKSQHLTFLVSIQKDRRSTFASQLRTRI